MSSTTVTITNDAPATGERPAQPNKPPEFDAEASRKSAGDFLKKSREAHDKSERAKSQARGEGAKFTKADTTTDKDADTATPEKDDKPAPQAEKAAEQTDKKPDTDAPKPDQARYETAMKALLRDGLEANDIAQWKPETVIARGEKAKKRQDEVDKAWQQAQNDRKELETLRSKSAESSKSKPNPASQEATDAKDEPAIDLDKIVEPISAKYKDFLGEDFDLGPELKAAFEQVLKANRPAPRDDSKVTALQEQFNAMVDNDRRKDLSKKFDELSDDAAWATLRKQADKLIESGLATDRATAMDSAAAMTYGLKAAEKAAKREAELDKAREKGQPYSGRHTNEPPAPSKPEDAAKAYLKQRRRELASESR